MAGGVITLFGTRVCLSLRRDPKLGYSTRLVHRSLDRTASLKSVEHHNLCDACEPQNAFLGFV